MKTKTSTAYPCGVARKFYAGVQVLKMKDDAGIQRYLILQIIYIHIDILCIDNQAFNA
jgi:hypothetical protein